MGRLDEMGYEFSYPREDMEGSNKMEMKDRGILNIVSVPSRGYGGF